MLRSKAKKTILTLKCVDCGNSYVMSDSEVKKFNETKTALPKRCRSCRRLGVIEKTIKLIKKIILKASQHEDIANTEIAKKP